jgi:hypothetical protein
MSLMERLFDDDKWLILLYVPSGFGASLRGDAMFWLVWLRV